MNWQKRFFDLLFSISSIIILSPVFILIISGFYLSKQKSPFFLQKRIGKNGKPFTIYKFRTMTLREDKHHHFEPGNRSRITRAGSFLRKLKLDELPQLWNILKGDMSVVGPRPEVEKWTSTYPEKWKVVHQVKPGLTDPASIKYINEENILAQSPEPEKLYYEKILPEKLNLNIKYVKNYSFYNDLRIILKTIKNIFSFKH